MRRSPLLRTKIALGTLAVALSLSPDARADEETPRQRTAWPLVLAGSGVVLAGTSMYFATRYIEFSDRADTVTFRAVEPGDRCEGTCVRFDDSRGKANLAATLSVASGLASVGAIIAAIVVHAREGRPSATAVTPVVAPGYGGAALSTTF